MSTKMLCDICVEVDEATKIGDLYICEDCVAYLNSPKRRHLRDCKELTRELAELLSAIELDSSRASRQYDIAMLLSGGKDSVYILTKLREDYPGLRILALTVDDGFQNAQAISNVHDVIQKHKGVDHKFIRPDPQAIKDIARYSILCAAESGEGYHIMDDFIGYLEFDMCRNYAYEHDIRYVVAGLNAVQADEYFNCNAGFSEPSEFSKRKREAISNTPIDFGINSATNLWWDGTTKDPKRMPQYIFPLAAWPVSEKKILQSIEREGVLKEKETHPLATCSDLFLLIVTLDYIHQGYPSVAKEVSKLIRMGLGQRQFWIDIFNAIRDAIDYKDPYLMDALSRILSKLDISPQEVGLNHFEKFR